MEPETAKNLVKMCYVGMTAGIISLIVLLVRYRGGLK